MEPNNNFQGTNSQQQYYMQNNQSNIQSTQNPQTSIVPGNNSRGYAVRHDPYDLSGQYSIVEHPIEANLFYEPEMSGLINDSVLVHWTSNKKFKFSVSKPWLKFEIKEKIFWEILGKLKEIPYDNYGLLSEKNVTLLFEKLLWNGKVPDFNDKLFPTINNEKRKYVNCDELFKEIRNCIEQLTYTHHYSEQEYLRLQTFFKYSDKDNDAMLSVEEFEKFIINDEGLDSGENAARVFNLIESKEKDKKTFEDILTYRSGNKFSSTVR